MARDNQPTLLEDSTDLFADPKPDRRRWQDAETWDKGHGRLAHRAIICSPDLNDWFAKQWQGLEQVFRLERAVRILHTESFATRSSMDASLLSLQQAPHAPALLARLNSTVLGLLDRLGVRNVFWQARSLDVHIEQAIQLLLTGRCGVF